LKYIDPTLMSPEDKLKTPIVSAEKKAEALRKLGRCIKRDKISIVDIYTLGSDKNPDVKKDIVVADIIKVAIEDKSPKVRYAAIQTAIGIGEEGKKEFGLLTADDLLMILKRGAKEKRPSRDTDTILSYIASKLASRKLAFDINRNTTEQYQKYTKLTKETYKIIYKIMAVRNNPYLTNQLADIIVKNRGLGLRQETIYDV